MPRTCQLARRKWAVISQQQDQLVNDGVAHQTTQARTAVIRFFHRDGFRATVPLLSSRYFRFREFPKCRSEELALAFGWRDSFIAARYCQRASSRVRADAGAKMNSAVGLRYSSGAPGCETGWPRQNASFLIPVPLYSVNPSDRGCQSVGLHG
jgi:hypothetical protein